jgi:hypothetical protein
MNSVKITALKLQEVARVKSACSMIKKLYRYDVNKGHRLARDLVHK